MKIDCETLSFPEDLNDSDYEDNSVDGKINNKSRTSLEVKNTNKHKNNSYCAPKNKIEAEDLFKHSELITGNNQKSIEFKNLVSLNIPGINDLNERGI